MEELLIVVLSCRKKKTYLNFTFYKINNPDNRAVCLYVYIFILVTNNSNKKNVTIHIILGQLKIVRIVPQNFAK